MVKSRICEHFIMSKFDKNGKLERQNVINVVSIILLELLLVLGFRVKTLMNKNKKKNVVFVTRRTKC